MEKMVHDPAIVDIKKCSRHPGTGLMLANFYTMIIHNVPCMRVALSHVSLRNDFRFRAPLTGSLEVFFSKLDCF